MLLLPNFHRPNDTGHANPVTKNVFAGRSAHVVEASPVDFAYVRSWIE